MIDPHTIAPSLADYIQNNPYYIPVGTPIPMHIVKRIYTPAPPEPPNTTHHKGKRKEPPQNEISSPATTIPSPPSFSLSCKSSAIPNKSNPDSPVRHIIAGGPPNEGRKSLMESEQSKLMMPRLCSTSAGKRYDWEPRIRDRVVRMPQRSSRGSMVDSARWWAAFVLRERETSATEVPRS